MQLGHLEAFFRQVDAQHVGAAAGHGIGQDAAAATHVETRLPPGDESGRSSPGAGG
jgi:hypothetical protein